MSYKKKFEGRLFLEGRLIDSTVRGYVQFDTSGDSSILEGSGYFDTSKPLLSSMLALYELVFDKPVLRINDEEISKIPIRLSFIDRRNMKYAAFKIDISRQRKQSSKKNAISN